jgi:hypothetical protein
MRKFALVLALIPVAACSTVTSSVDSVFGGELTAEQRARGIKPVATLASDYKWDRYMAKVRRRSDGIDNAFGRDLGSISSFIDRHIYNYDANDPYINVPSDTTELGHVADFGVGIVTALPVVGAVLR